ncbi:MAG: hypothetical protein JNM06_01600 [Blastocatellia bacterium]|nr:hypothetical protein [Blastocatellia bacterium]
MTVEEMFQLLINEIKEIKTGQAKLEDNQLKLEAKVDGAIADIGKLETKVDGAIADIAQIKEDIADIKSDVQYLKNSDEIDTISINGAYNGIKELNTKFDKFIIEFNHQRRFTQKALGDLNSDILWLDERVQQLEQEKKAS